MKKIYHLDNEQYIPMENSKIFLSISNSLDIQKRFVAYEIYNEKKTENKDLNINQKSFYFDDYLETNKKINLFRRKIY